MRTTHQVRYRAPDSILCDAVYCSDEGGINPPRGRSFAWTDEPIRVANPFEKYEAIRRSRSTYQGFWVLRATTNERSKEENDKT